MPLNRKPYTASTAHLFEQFSFGLLGAVCHCYIFLSRSSINSFEDFNKMEQWKPPIKFMMVRPKNTVRRKTMIRTRRICKTYLSFPTIFKLRQGSWRICNRIYFGVYVINGQLIEVHEESWYPDSAVQHTAVQSTVKQSTSLGINLWLS